MRIAKTVGAATTRYHFDDKDRLVRESDAANNTIALYTYDEDDRLVAIEKAHGSSWDIFYPHTNWRGDIIGVTNSSGVQVATYKYDPWGTLITKTGTFDTPMRYAGYYFEVSRLPTRHLPWLCASFPISLK